VGNALIRIGKVTSSVIKNNSIKMTHTCYHLHGMSQVVSSHDTKCDRPTKWAPYCLARELRLVQNVLPAYCARRVMSLTAVSVSMQRMNGSEVRYLESESAYSFHNCENRACDFGMVAWLITK